MNAEPQQRARRNRLLLIAAIAFVVGVLADRLLLHRMAAKPHLPAYAAEILAVLARNSQVALPPKGVACEIAASRGRLTIGDFIASYVQWSYGSGRRMHSSLDCEGDPLLRCVWMFGESKATEGWGRFLHFQYDRRSQTLDPQSLACIDVP